MEALVYDGGDDYEVRTVPEPDVETPTDAIVEVRCALSSGTDKHLFDDPVVEEGRILGPEFVGTVAETGSDVSAFDVGDRVVPAVMTHCGDCFFCERGLWANCADGGWEMGYTRDGGRAEYARVRYADENLFRIPESLSYEDAVLAASSLPTGWEAAERGGIRPGDSVAIIGAGAIGLCSLACVRLYGPAQIAISDLIDSRLERAERMGADTVVNDDEDSAIEAFGRLNGGRGPDVVIEAGGFEETYHLALDAVRPGGTVSLIAYHQDTYEIPFGDVWEKHIEMNTGYVNGTAVPRMLNLVANGRLSLDPVLTDSIPLTEIDGREQLESPERIKTVIRVN